MSTNKVVLLCRLGGKFIWESNNVYYKGGTNWIVHVDRAINYLNLLRKVCGICKLTDISSIQYKYPGLDLDSLVSIENDDDISHMMEAFLQSNEPIQLFVLCAQKPSIPRMLILEMLKHHCSIYMEVIKHLHLLRIMLMPITSASNDLNNPVNNMQKVMPVLKEGQEFENANAFHEALREYAICSNFQYRRTRSGHGRFQAKCIKDDCLWCIRACKLPDKPTFKIKLLKGNHTCNAANEPTMSNTKTHQQANRKWIATLVKDRLRKNLDCTPKDIIDEISREYKIEVSYDKAWRGKELALKEMHVELSYPDLRMLCKDIEMTNPRSIAKLSRSSDNSLRLFIAYKAAICGFKKACRPVVRLDRKKIEGEYPGEWFFATAIDATCVDFPVSYAFVESESIESWKWFCGELTQVLESISGLTFISDRQEGILEDVRDFFPYACHRYRLKGLFDEIRQKFECDELLDLFRSATYAPFHSEFDDCMRQIQGKYKEAWNFVKDINPKHWATSHFEGKFNVYCDFLPFHWLYWVVCWGNQPITPSLLKLHGNITRAFSCSFEESSEWTTISISCVQDVISSVEKDSERYSVSGSATEFEVVGKGEGAFKVDIQRGACPCLFSQRHAYPCEHVIAAILYSGCNVYEFLDYFTVAKYRETYSEVIHPLTFKPELMKKRKYVHH